MTAYTNLSGISADGVIESSIQGAMVGTVTTMPTASAANLGLTVMYTGATVNGYVKNTLYTCVQNGSSYSWSTALSPAPDISGLVPNTRKVAGHALSADVTISASDVGAVPTSRTVNSKALSADITLAASDVGAVPTSRKVNNKALSSNITLSASDVGAVPTTRTVNGVPLSDDVTLTPSDIDAVPTTRTVNNKALSADISLTAADVGALASNGTAAKATADASGNNIVNTYATKTTVPSAYQAKLTFDTTPTDSSTNPVTSGGVKSYVDTAVTGAYKVKGSKTVAQINALTSKVQGDVYNVTNAGTITNGPTVLAGDNVVWTGSEWDKLAATIDLSGYVPTSRTVNSKALSGNITLAASDVGAVPTTRTVNSKALSADISLSASDVSAIPSSYLSTAKPTSSSTDTQVPSAKAVYTGLAEKMNAMTVDSAPTENSNNLVKSGGVYSAIQAAAGSDLTTQSITVPTSLGSVNVTGVTASSIVWVSPAPTSFSVYTTAGVYCSAQGDGTLTFTSSKTPTADMTVNVVIAN